MKLETVALLLKYFNNFSTNQMVSIGLNIFRIMEMEVYEEEGSDLVDISILSTGWTEFFYQDVLIELARKINLEIINQFGKNKIIKIDNLDEYYVENDYSEGDDYD